MNPLKRTAVPRRQAALPSPFVLALAFFALATAPGLAHAQWTATGGGDHGGADWSPTGVVGGVHTNIGTFTVASGTTVTVSPSAPNVLEVQAININIVGLLSGDGAGFTGGAGGAAAACGTGYPGGAGGSAGSGGVLAGAAGGCGTANGTYGGGGGGGGGGGAYGGPGGGGATGGTVYNGGVCSTTGGGGGAPGSGAGVSNDETTSPGGGGGGAGGGGSGNSGSGETAGGPGGAGGASIRLIASGTLTVSGTVSSNGAAGSRGGDGRTCGGTCGGTGGGGGGGAGGGSGGGILLKGAVVLNTGSVVSANGGAGGNGGNAGACAGGASGGNGGAGGGGGRVKISYSTLTNNGSVSANGGTGGAAGNTPSLCVNCNPFVTGGSGANGASGTVAAFSCGSCSASFFTVSGLASPRTAGTPGTLTVTVKDGGGSTFTAYRGTVRFTSSDALASLPANYTFTAADNGVHTFSVTLYTAGTQSVKATDTAVATITGSQTGIGVSPAGASQLVVSGISSPRTAGVTSDVVVEARDPYGNRATGYNGTIRFSSSDAAATFPANYTFTAADAGIRTFSPGVTLKTAGTHSVTATDTSVSSITGSQTGISVSPGAPTRLVVSGIGSPRTAGAASDVVVEARDSFGNRTTAYTGNVRFTSSDGAATLPANYTFTAADAGLHIFSSGVTLYTAGTQSVTATDTTTSITGAQSGISVSPAGATNFLVSGISSPRTAGVASDLVVEARDAFGNRVTSYTGTARFLSSDLSAALPANYTFTASDAGQHTFIAGVTLKSAGTQSVTATDTVSSSLTGTQSGIVVNAGSATSFVVSGISSPRTAGVASNLTLDARDSFGNRATGYTGTVSITSSDPQAVLPANYAFTAADAGLHTFTNGVTLKTSGSQSVTAKDTTTSISGSQTVTVTTAAASALVVSGISSPRTAGVASDVVVDVRDGFGNRVTGYTGTVRFTSSDAAAALPANYTFVASDAGLHTFVGGVTLKTSGTQSVTATDTATASLTGSQSAITVSPATAASLIVSGLPASMGAGTAGSLTLDARDAFGNRVTGYTGTVAITSSDPQAVLPANYTFTASDAGLHTFTNGVTLKTSGSQSVSAKDTSTSISGSQTVTVTNASASVVVLSGIASPRTAGVASDLTAEIRDGFGNRVTGYTGTLRFTSSDAAAALPANYTFTATDAGLHTFTGGVTLKTSGTQSVTATDTSLASLNGTQSAITVNPAAAATLVVSGIGSPITAGTAASVTVDARDAFGNRVTAYTGTVAFTSNDPQAVLPANYTFVASDAGVHTFSSGVTLKTSGSRSVTARDTSTSITGSQTVTVNPATASAVVVSGISSPRTAGIASDVVVDVRDSFGNRVTGYTGTVRFTSSDAAAVLPANYTFVASDAGLHTFTGGVTLKTSGAQSVTATDTTTASLNGAQTGITVTPAAASTLVVSGIPSPVTAGSAASVTVDARDPFGNRATAYTGTIAFTSTDGQAVLPANYTFIASDAGLHTFSNGVTLKTVGSQSVTAKDTSASVSGSQTVTVNTAGASTFVVTGISSPRTAGVVSSVTVEARDSFGNRATGYTGIVHFASSDAQAALPANYAFVAADAGIHTFTNGVTLKTSGTQSVTATDTVSASINGAQVGITVNPATAAVLAVTGISSPRTAGLASNVSVEARDTFGNRATGYTGSVHFTSSDPQAVVPADYAFLASDAGLHAFVGGVTLKTTGTQSVTATDTATASITGAQTGIVVTPAAASTFVVSGISSPRTAGIASDVTVDVRDAFGNRATGYTGTVLFGSTDGAAALPSNYTFVAGDAGLHTFNGAVTLKTSGSQKVTVTDTGNASLTGAQSGIVVTPAAATQLVVSGIGSPRTAGVASDVTVEAKDAFGNRATGYTGAVRFTSTDGAAVLPANYAFVAADAGLHTFTGAVTLKTAGSQSVTATDTASASVTGAQTGIAVNPAAATAIFASGLTSPRTAGVAGTLTVEAKDPFGNRATGFTGTVSFSSSDAQAALPASYAFTSTDAGIHGFTVTLKTAATSSVTATSGSLNGSQTGIVVRPAAATRLVVAGLTSPRTAGTPGTVSVEAKDAFGNRATGYTGSVKFSSTDAQATLPASYTFSATDAGLASFPVTLATAGTQSVTATDGADATITGTQSGIAVQPAAAASFAVTGIASPRTAGIASGVTVEAFDAFGNRATGYAGTVAFTSTDAQAALPSSYAFTAGDAGLHTFAAGVTLKTAGTQTVGVADAAQSTVNGEQANIQVTPAAASTLLAGGLVSPTVAGTQGTLTVEAKDAFGNRATGYTGTVSFTSTDAQAGLPGAYTFTAADAGQKSLFVTLKTSGTQSVTATDAATASLTATQSGIVVKPAPAATLVAGGFSSPTVAGTAGSLKVEARDAFGNLAIDFAGTVQLSSDDPAATLAADYTFVAADAGTHTFDSLVLRTAGSRQLKVSSTGLTSGAQTAIEVLPAAASALVVSGITSPRTAGVISAITVEAHDAFGNVATGYTGSVHFTSSDTQALLPADTTFTALNAGVVSLSSAVTLKTAGTQSVTATDTTDSSITGTQGNVSVIPATATAFVVSGLADPGTAGASQTVTVRAVDVYGNTATAYAGSVSFTSTDAAATLPAGDTFGAGDAGTKTFTGLSFATAGQQSVTVTDSADATVAGKSTVTVDPAAPFTVAVKGPASGTVGQAQSFSLAVLDRFGNAVPGARALTVTLRSSTGAQISATTLANASTGAATASGDTALDGTAGVTAADTKAEAMQVCATGPSLTGPESCAAFTWLPGPADHIVLVPGSGTPVAGVPSTITVKVVDQYGNAVAAAVDVTATAGGSATFGSGGSTTNVTTDAATGEATITVVTDKAEPVSLQVTQSTQNGTPLPEQVPNGSINVSFQSGAADHVAVTAPAAALAGTSVTAQLALVDRLDNPLVGAGTVCVTVSGAQGSPTVTALLLGNPAQAGTAKVCGDLDATTGKATVSVKSQRAEQVTIALASSNLPGSGHDGQATVLFGAASADHLRVAPRNASSNACGTVTVDLQVVDAFDNAITDPAIAQKKVTVKASAASGAPQISATTLAGVTGTLPAASVTGTLKADGSATLDVTLDADQKLTLDWTSADLPADPAKFSSSVTFVPGAPDAAKSTFTASGTQVEAGWGSVLLTLVPRDACGVKLGTGHTAALTATDGLLTTVTDNMDGTYSARFSAKDGDCATQPSTISATVDAVAVGTVQVKPVCSKVDPASPYTVTTAEVDACASGGTFAQISVVPRGDSGLALAPGQDVTVEADGTLLVKGMVKATTDSASGVTTYTVEVGSNRCGKDRDITLRVNGVALTPAPKVTFRCVDVDPTKVTFKADPATLPADGMTAAAVTVAALDKCGNPAFGRTVKLTSATALPLSFEPATKDTTDALGKPEDGTARFLVRGNKPGVTGLRADIAGVESFSAKNLLTFQLPEVLTGTLTAGADAGVKDQPFTFTLKLSNNSGADLAGLVVKPTLTGGRLDSVTGATDAGDGTFKVDALAAGGQLEITFNTVPAGDAPLHLDVAVDYGADGVEDRHTLPLSAEVQVNAAQDPNLSGFSTGCGCSGAGGEGSFAALGLFAVLGLSLLRRRSALHG